MGTAVTHHGERYQQEGCSRCHGEPPDGYTCMTCFSVTGGSPRVFEQFSSIELGDTDELDSCWDQLMEYDAVFNLALAGVSPVVISRLFRMAVDATKGWVIPSSEELDDLVTDALDQVTCKHDMPSGCIHCRAEWVTEAVLRRLENAKLAT